jgi:type I restriction enzyme S subunit
MLPEGWTRATINDYVDLMTGFAFASVEYIAADKASVRLLRGDNVMQGSLRWDDAKRWPTPYDKQLLRYEMQAGDIAVAMDRPITNAGLKLSVVQPHDLPCLLVQRVARLRAKTDLDQRYLVQVLLTHEFIQHLEGQKTETAVPHVSPNDIRSFAFFLPVKVEQRRIAEILSTWDQAIVTTQRLLANSRAQKQALAESLLTGKRRLAHRQKWISTKLKELIVESRVLGSGGDTAKKITVKLYGRGVVGKLEKRIGSESTQYYRRSTGQFIYSKLDFLNGAFGLIPEHLDGYESTLDLPAFDFLHGVDPRWFLYLVSQEAFYLGHLGLANGGRKARRVNPSDLLRVSIQIPALEEQKAIANLLDAAQAEVNNFSNQLSAFRQEKAALMTQLLTGKRRVRLPEVEAEISP